MSAECSSYSNTDGAFVDGFSCPRAGNAAVAVYCCGFNDVKYCCDDPNSFFAYEYGYMWWLSQIFHSVSLRPSGLEIVGSGITFIQNRRGKNSGEAFVQFSSKEAAEEALQKDRELIGQRYIEVFPSSTEQIYSSWVGKSSSVSPQTGTQFTNRRKASDSWDRQGSPQGHHIHMRGLPYQVTAEDVVKFFSPLVVSKITIACSPEGRPNGEAEVYFSTHQDALSAMSRDRDYIGQRYVELFLNSSED
ncbi:heterogeneous nuclear ribonucleoprotein F-like [Notothenia coriiceps]|uniref:Heterogeneous nuclear ribonucleoprotein F-like n=1 Tax=Notothenia coriiceps TaxID=8208 RepID=A0A6I9NVQ3_9TELE|nr:PREDICTED: heterogeneous nuclear ribonucleoprotein F-like [Notothenia coriiceps]